MTLKNDQKNVLKHAVAEFMASSQGKSLVKKPVSEEQAYDKFQAWLADKHKHGHSSVTLKAIDELHELKKKKDNEFDEAKKLLEDSLSSSMGGNKSVYDRVKDIGGRVYDKAKEVGGNIVDKGKGLASTAGDFLGNNKGGLIGGILAAIVGFMVGGPMGGLIGLLLGGLLGGQADKNGLAPKLGGANPGHPTAGKPPRQKAVAPGKEMAMAREWHGARSMYGAQAEGFGPEEFNDPAEMGAGSERFNDANPGRREGFSPAGNYYDGSSPERGGYASMDTLDHQTRNQAVGAGMNALSAGMSEGRQVVTSGPFAGTDQSLIPSRMRSGFTFGREE